MPIRWRGVFIGTGLFYLGYVTGRIAPMVSVSHQAGRAMKDFNLTAEELDKIFTRSMDELAAKQRQDIATLEANGDSESWNKAQELKVKLNKAEAGRAKFEQTRSEREKMNKSFEWSYRGSADVSFGTDPQAQNDNTRAKEVDKIVEGALQEKIDDLKAEGDLRTAEEVKARLAKLKARNQIAHLREK